MVDIFPGISAFNGMLGAAKALKDINDTVIRNQASIDLQGQILTAQEAYAALLKKVDALETEVATFKTWDGEKQRYELKVVTDFSKLLAYTLKESEQSIEPAHWICPDCYAQRKKTILQTQRRDGGVEVLACNVCGWDGYLQGRAPTPNRPRR